MGWYSDLKIRSKLLLGYSATTVVCILVGYYGISGMASIKARLDDTRDNLIVSISAIGEADRHTQQHDRLVLRYLVESDSAVRQDLLAQIRREELEAQDFLGRFGKMPLLPQERTRFDSLLAAWTRYRTMADRLIETAETRTQDALLQAERRQLRPAFTEVEESIRGLINFNVEEASQHYQQSSDTYGSLRAWLTGLVLTAVFLAAGMALLITGSVAAPLRLVVDVLRSLATGSEEKARVATAIADGDLTRELSETEPFCPSASMLSHDETGSLLDAAQRLSEAQGGLDRAFSRMTGSLRRSRDTEQAQDWLKTGLNEANLILRGEKTPDQLTDEMLTYCVGHVGGCVGAVYLISDDQHELLLTASYALPGQGARRERIEVGEGLVGQVARSRQVLCVADVPEGYLPIASATGKGNPASVAVVPLLFKDSLAGCLEIAGFKRFNAGDLDFLIQVGNALAVTLGMVNSRRRVAELLQEAQQQAEELLAQQEELQQSNEELEERAQLLERQGAQIRAQNHEIETASAQLQSKAEELERISAFKSEFLANMSHELRSPLNSLLILSGILQENRDGNMTEKQVQFAATIHGAGTDLLNLINDILDLSKIESGRTEFHMEPAAPGELCASFEALYRPVADARGLRFAIELAETLPPTISTDRLRCEQILRNLLANAFKFTEDGEVWLRVRPLDAASSPLQRPTIAFEVGDTGIGVAPDKQELVFQAFHQADGSTSRVYGGTGLGLSIALKLSQGLGGSIRLVSEEGKGSVFTLYLPLESPPATREARPSSMPSPTVAPPPAAAAPKANLVRHLTAPLADDREALQSGSRAILVIEDDLSFAQVVVDMVRDRHFAALVATDGESGVALAEEFAPSAIILDILLPRLDGWTVMEHLKENPRTRHIPVHFISCLDEEQKALAMGAIGFVRKPVGAEQIRDVLATIEEAVERTVRRLLVVESDPAEARAIVDLLSDRSLEVRTATSGQEALDLLARDCFDCLVLDPELPDRSGYDVLEHVRREGFGRKMPVIIHSGQQISHADEVRLRRYAESIIIKGVRSHDRLLSEVSLFLHLVESKFAPPGHRAGLPPSDLEEPLAGKKVLLVDDDIRNIFSLSSMLSGRSMVILEAENGEEALRILDVNPDVDIVLMDIMMPRMDGYEAMRRIRCDPRFVDLPIIAMTAKAMQGDREKCLEAGASDYLSKPLDTGKLLSLLRVWVYR